MGVAVLVLAVARLTRLVTTDKVTESLRIRVVNRWGADAMISYFVHCPWCVSVYAAAPLAVGYVLAGDTWWYQIPALLLAASYITGALNRFTEAD